MKVLEVRRYAQSHKTLWDDFVNKSKNGVFLFYRDYMEYHASKFTDCSLMFFDENKLIAVMPANIKDNVLISHGGLTFGGIISDDRMRTPIMLQVFDILNQYLATMGVEKVRYKVIPHIYHSTPSEEDRYALFLRGAKLIGRDVSASIPLREKVGFSKGRKWSTNKAKQAGVDVKRSYDFKTFMALEEELLEKKYGVKPTHSVEEIESLATRFSENIKLFGAHRAESMVAGVLVYESINVAHAQYVGNSQDGKTVFGADAVLSFLINEYYLDKKYFDFGISTEKSGWYLNVGLDEYKESFGARAIMYDCYEIDIVK